MSDERERAEQLWQKLTRLEAAHEAQDIYIAREYVDLIVAFAREERARGIEEFVKEYEAHKWSWGGPVKSLIQFGREYLISKLREEGGQR